VRKAKQNRRAAKKSTAAAALSFSDLEVLDVPISESPRHGEEKEYRIPCLRQSIGSRSTARSLPPSLSLLKVQPHVSGCVGNSLEVLAFEPTRGENHGWLTRASGRICQVAT